MKSYQTINNIVGWVVFAIALVTYTLTLEPTASFWDCGEFIAGAYKMQVVHPPGAPLFLLIGRMFTLFAPDPSYVAYTINFLSGLTSALAVLFLFWIITALAKKILSKDGEPSTENTWAIMAAGFVGALACTFSDTIWFSAVEGEVYAMSTFFLSLVFWCILKWEASTDVVHRDKWLILAAFLVGISIGVHLLSLLAIPAMALVYYFKKYENPSFKGMLAAVGIGFLILAFVFKGVISILVTVVAKFDLLFVNSFGMPFGSGAVFFFVSLIGLLVFGLYISRRKGQINLHTALLSLSMILIGFSTYLMVAIRADVDTPLNMNDPSDVFRLESYLNREQYGDRPLLNGPHYKAYPIEVKKTGKKYYPGKTADGKDQYVEVGDKVKYEFDSKDMMLFPRIGSWQDDRHVRAYQAMLGLGENDIPTFRDNMRFFFSYQVGFMYIRYFMWNFSGRQNDIQGRYDNNDGNWITGIGFIDDMLIGPQENMPEVLKENKARNAYFLLPFLLGILGAVYHFKKDEKSAFVILALFLFTGAFQVIYLNSPPFEPRERDYTLVASFLTFCIWIGFGVLFLYDLLRKKMGGKTGLALALALSLLAPVLMAAENWDDHDRSERYTARDFAINYLESCAPNAIIFTQGDNDTYPLWYVQEVEGIRTDVRVVNLSLLGVDWYISNLRHKANDAPPVNLTLDQDDYLGNRRDIVRYFANTKFAIDEYRDVRSVLKFIADDSRKSQVPMSGGDWTNYLPTKKLTLPVDMNSVRKNNVIPADMMDQVVPELRWSISSNNLLKNDLVTLDIIASNLWERPIYFAVSVSPDSYLGLGKYFQLEGLAYRIVPVETGRENDRMSPGYIAHDIMYDNLMNKFVFGGIERKQTISYEVKANETLEDISAKFEIPTADIRQWNQLNNDNISAGQKLKIEAAKDIYMDENALRMTMNMRTNYARLAESLAETGDKKRAIEVLDHCIEVMPRANVPYNVFVVRYPEIYYKAGDKERARMVIRGLAKTYLQEYQYATDLIGVAPDAERNRGQAGSIMQELIRQATQYQDKEMADELRGMVGGLQ